MSRGTGDAGHAALELVLVVAVLLVPVTMLLATVPVWIERQAGARDAATAAARSAIIQADPAAVAGAVTAAEQAWGLPPGSLSWAAEGQPAGRTGVFTVMVTVELPAIDLPMLGPIGAVGWTTSHSESVPAYPSR
ncbi:MAG: hypothetical protein GY713_09650 [Actinomycetia bacterium]|nr:hypothetical protein [Actinomycetes bacterium]